MYKIKIEHINMESFNKLRCGTLPLRKIFATISFACLFLAACSSDSDEIQQPEQAEIQPTTNIGVVKNEGASRGGGVKESGSAIDISVFRADEEYATTWTGVTALPAAVATDGKVTFTTAQYYKPNDVKTKLIGVYPVVGTGWSAANGTVTYTIDGSTDIMATSFTESAKGGSPVLAFQHLLTQVKITVIAESQEAIDMWGAINSVTVNGRTDECVVELPMPDKSTAPTTTFSKSGDDLVNLTVCNPASGAAATALTLAEPEEDYSFGICMFEPVTTAAKLPLKVTTSIGGGVDVEVPERTYLVTTAYVIQLKLTVKGIIATATVQDWTPDGGDPSEVEL